MSGFRDAIFGSRGTPSQVVDTTPEAFAALQGPLASQLRAQIFNPAQFTGQFTAPLGQAEQQALSNVQQAAGAVGQPGTGQQFLTQAGSTFNPFAGLTGLEQQGINTIAQQAFQQNPLLAQAQGFLAEQLGGQGLQGQLQQIASGNNPLVDQLIESASRPILENFSDQALAQRGLFTGAGQQVQGQGSSPFAQASARLSSGVASALGDVGTQIAAQEQQRQLQALGLAQQTGLQAAGLSDQLSGNALTRALAGLQAAGTGQERGGQAFESAANRQLQAGAELGSQGLQQQTQQLQAQLQNLEAQGLPRMIEQFGIEGGLAEFQRQQQQLLQLLSLTSGLASGTSQVLPGTPGTPGALQAFAGGFGQGFGGSVGGGLFGG